MTVSGVNMNGVRVLTCWPLDKSATPLSPWVVLRFLAGISEDCSGEGCSVGSGALRLAVPVEAEGVGSVGARIVGGSEDDESREVEGTFALLCEGTDADGFGVMVAVRSKAVSCSP